MHDVALQKLPVLFCMDRAGLSGDDGPTHHGLFDIGYLRGIPEMVLMAPKDEDELADMMKTALSFPVRAPSAIRAARLPAWTRKPEPQALPIGKAEVLADGSDVAILGLGPMIALAQELGRAPRARRLLRRRHQSALHQAARSRNARAYARRVAAFVTFEDHVKMGGFGSAVVEALEEMGIARFPWSASAGPTSSSSTARSTLRAKYGLTVDAAYDAGAAAAAHRQRRTLVAS